MAGGGFNGSLHPCAAVLATESSLIDNGYCSSPESSQIDADSCCHWPASSASHGQLTAAASALPGHLMTAVDRLRLAHHHHKLNGSVPNIGATVNMQKCADTNRCVVASDDDRHGNLDYVARIKRTPPLLRGKSLDSDKEAALALKQQSMTSTYNDVILRTQSCDLLKTTSQKPRRYTKNKSLNLDILEEIYWSEVRLSQVRRRLIDRSFIVFIAAIRQPLGPRAAWFNTSC